MISLPSPDFTAICKKLEHYETPAWAAAKILEHEILTRFVFDPCAGTGIMTMAALDAGYDVASMDIRDWGFPIDYNEDFLISGVDLRGHTAFMNPPFSLAEEFVEKSLELGARKIVMFQRLAFWESDTRKDFWAKHPPQRIYTCADRATCWRHDLPADEKGNRYDSITGKKLSESSTANAWYVWERGNPSGTLFSHIRK